MFKTYISISMKKIALLLLLVIPAALVAQVNEMFYVPKKSVKQENVSSILSSADDDWGTVGNANTRDVDEYNRRGTTTVSADNVESLLQAENSQTENYEYEYVDETSDYDYSTRIVRFHSPTTVVVSSPWYYDVYPARFYYDNYYDSYLNWSIGWGGPGWGISAGWHYPLSWNWGCAPVYPHHHHHHHVVAPPVNRVRSRVPTASIAGGGSNRRQSIGSVSAADKRKPATQVNNRKTERRTSVSTTQGSGSGKRRENVGSSSSSRGSGNSSTYNRRSSTSVRSSGSRSRSSVGSAPRSNSRSSASPSRGGTPRGGRR